jgi:O-acetyl-ADP-ribose deacetylase (regulator of RNase III)
MALESIQGDITKLRVDAIVNAANGGLLRGGGVCGAIFAAAGAKEMEAACAVIGGCNTGQAVITVGFRLPARYVVHTVGPVWRGGRQNEEMLLRSCYTQSLELAKSYGLKSIAFPLISSGIFGYPKERAAAVAVSAIRAFLLENDMHVILVLFDDETYRITKALS